MHQYTYYGDGSLQHVTNAGGTSTLASYAYTPDGLLSQATFNGRTLTNTWDAATNRVTLTTPGATYDLKREFVYDPTAGIPAVVQETQVNDPQNSKDDVHVHYFREPDGALIARVQDSSVHYYHFDALGSTRLLTNADADITDRYAYDAYGSLISHERLSGSIDQPYQYVGQLGYYTHWMEPEFGLLQLGVRFYDSEIGRFTQRDAVPKMDEAAYAYARTNPHEFVDPSGLDNRSSFPTRIWIDSSCDEMRDKLQGYIYYDPEDEAKKSIGPLDPDRSFSDPIDNVYWFDPQSKRWYGARTPNGCRVWITCHPGEAKWFRVHWSCGFVATCFYGGVQPGRPVPDLPEPGGRKRK